MRKNSSTTTLAVILGGFFTILLGAFYYAATPQIAFDAPIVVTFGFFLGLFLFVSPFFLKGSLKLFLVGAVLIGLTTVPSCSMFNAARYHALLGEEKVEPFEAQLPHLELKEAPLVSYEMALLAAQRRLSEIPGIGSVTEVTRMEKQIIQGKLTWIGFLEHKRFTAWWNKRTTPGYVRVSAHDPSDVDLITEYRGKPLALRYLNSGYFGDNIERHLRFNGFATDGLDEAIYEVDDEGKPWIVVTTFDRMVGTMGHESNGIALIDVQTGEITRYKRDDVPAWVDRVEPSDFIKEQVEDRLEFVHGWFNPSKTDELRQSGQIDTVYVNGKARYLVGLTSTSKEGGLVGFLSIDTRTKAVLRHQIGGATESVAQNAVEHVNPEKRYTATNALPFLVAGTPAYVMTLRDSNGLARAFGIVAIGDVQHVATADTLAAAARLFQTRAAVNRTAIDTGEHDKSARITTKVKRINAEVRNGNTSYTLVLEGQSGRLYVADANLSEELAVTREGDIVEVVGADSGSRIVPLAKFDNQMLAAPAAPEAPAAAPPPAPVASASKP